MVALCVIWGSSQVLYIPYRCKVEQLDALQQNGMTNSEILFGVLGSCVREDGKCTRLRVRSSGSAFCRNQSSKGEGHAEADKNLLVIVCILDGVCSYSILSIISTTLYVDQTRQITSIPSNDIGC